MTVRQWLYEMQQWWVQIPILCGPRRRCPSCQQPRERAFAPGEAGYETAKPSIFRMPDDRFSDYRHGPQPPNEECSGCGAPPGMFQR